MCLKYQMCNLINAKFYNYNLLSLFTSKLITFRLISHIPSLKMFNKIKRNKTLFFKIKNFDKKGRIK